MIGVVKSDSLEPSGVGSVNFSNGCRSKLFVGWRVHKGELSSSSYSDVLQFMTYSLRSTRPSLHLRTKSLRLYGRKRCRPRDRLSVSGGVYVARRSRPYALSGACTAAIK